jgi:regulator of sigma E protease
MAGLLIAVGLVLLIVAHELGHFLAAKAFKLHVHEFGVGFPPRLFARKRGETEYSVNALPIGGFVRIAGEDEDSAGVPPEKLLSAQPPWKRALVIVAGVAVNAVIAWVLLTGIFMVGTPHVVVISQVEDGSPAAAAGVQPNDLVLGYNSADEFAKAARSAIGGTFTFDVQRGVEEVEVTVTPREISESQPGALGVGLTEGGIDETPFWKAPWEALKTTWHISVATVEGFASLIARLFTGSVPGDVVGPVGIVSTAGQVSGIGTIYLFQMLAVISINLAILNLLPIPALDGGRLYMTLIEWATGKKMPHWLEVRVNAVTFLILIALMLLLTARDVLRLF